MWKPPNWILFILDYLVDLSGSGTPRTFYNGDVPRDRFDRDPLREPQPERYCDQQSISTDGTRAAAKNVSTHFGYQ